MPNNYDGSDRRKQNDKDHDLLLTINSKLNNFIDVFDGHAKFNQDVHDDHESRLRFLEKGYWVGIGALAILQIFLKFYKQ